MCASGKLYKVQEMSGSANFRGSVMSPSYRFICRDTIFAVVQKKTVHKAHLLHNFCELKKVQPRQDSAKNSAFDVVEQSSFTCWVQAIKLFMAIISICALTPINLTGHRLNVP